MKEITEKQRRMVYNIIVGIINNHNDAEDLTQDVLISFSKSTKTNDSYLRTMARNKALKYKPNYNCRYCDNIVDERETFRFIDIDCVDKSGLTPIQREVVRLKYTLRLKRADIANVMNKSIRWVDAVLYRARNIMRRDNEGI